MWRHVQYSTAVILYSASFFLAVSKLFPPVQHFRSLLIHVSNEVCLQYSLDYLPGAISMDLIQLTPGFLMRDSLVLRIHPWLNFSSKIIETESR